MADERWIAGPTDDRVDEMAQKYVDLSHPRLGTEAVACTDDFFAPMHRMLSPEPAIFIEDKYDDHGKWMDGWESRRKRIPGHDWCLIRLGVAGTIRAIDIDTSHFTGNFPPEASVEAFSGPEQPADDAQGVELVPRMTLQGNSHHLVEVESDQVWHWLRLNIFPDGGVARLRVFGEIHKDWEVVSADEQVDLAAQLNGGVAVAWNDAHYGVPANMIAPGKGVNMGDGWETARRRVPGNDWSILKLGHRGAVEKILVDTAFFKGNYPDRCSIRAIALDDDANLDQIGEDSASWPLLLDEQRLSADSEHEFEPLTHDPVTHIRLDIFPDGGVSRLRLFGKKR
ncbi:MAG: allantoicase [Pseudomonadota bacterium]